MRYTKDQLRRAHEEPRVASDMMWQVENVHDMYVIAQNFTDKMFFPAATNQLNSIKSFGYVPGDYTLWVMRSSRFKARIVCGCRFFTYDEAIRHWTGRRGVRAEYLRLVLPAIKLMLTHQEGWDFHVPTIEYSFYWTEIDGTARNYTSTNKHNADSNYEYIKAIPDAYKNVSVMIENDITGKKQGGSQGQEREIHLAAQTTPAAEARQPSARVCL